jgi:hypothetical protein
MTGNFTAKCAKMKAQRAQSIGALCGYLAFLAVKKFAQLIHPYGTGVFTTDGSTAGTLPGSSTTIGDFKAIDTGSVAGFNMG